jgi:phospholipase/lecithinase/hemolysin
MKRLFQSAIGVLFLGLAVLPAQAAFTSLYIFGDALSSTADGTGSLYYSGRDSNGRVWVEVLAQRQGLTYDASKNNSYYDHNSAITVTDVNNFTAPADVANDLFIVWVCNADTFDAAQVPDNSAQWQAAINQSQTNHLQIITNLYAKGVRTLILPNAVDISEIPAFNAGTTLTSVEHAGCVAYNVALSNTIKQARTLCPGLTIYAPDFFTLLNNVLTNSAAYGLTNALSAKGLSIDALTALYTTQPVQLNGPGTNYVFWDNQDPTAETHAVIADVVQQIISPVQVSQITALNGSNQMVVANMPVGLNGFVDATTNLTQPSWTVVQNITSTSTTQSVFVAQLPTTTNTNVSGAFASGGKVAKPADSDPGLLGGPPPNYIALEFYRLRFPYAWNWP